MKFSSYPTIPSVVAADTILVHQQSANAEKQITAQGLADSISGMESELVIAGLKAVDVSTLSTGAHRTLSGYLTAGDGGGGPFYYNSASTATDNGGTVIAPNVGAGRWLRPVSRTFNVRWFGAVGNAVANDTNAIQAAINAVKAAGIGAVYVPAGTYKLTDELSLADTPACNISLIGDGPNVSVLYQTNGIANGVNFSFLNTGTTQPNRVTINKIGLTTSSTTGTAIVVSYGSPAATINHFNSTVVIDDVAVRSDGAAGAWGNGIDIRSAWNCIITNSVISGSTAGGVYTNLAGDGIRMREYVVNSHISDVQCNFWLNGFHYTAAGAGVGDGNTEGLFFSNCSMTAVRRGVYIEGNGNASAPRVSGVTWIGGLMDTRACIACFDLKHVEDLMIGNTFLIHANPSGANYGIRMDTCGDVSIRGVEFFALDNGVYTTGTCFGIVSSDCVYRGISTQVTFGAATTNSSSRNAVIVGSNPFEVNSGGVSNKMYQGQHLGASVYLLGDQSTTDTVDHTMSWEAARFNSGVGPNFIWNAGAPTKLSIPSGVSFVKVSAGTRWEANGSGGRKVRIRSNPAPANAIWAGDDKAVGVDLGDSAISTGIIPTNGIDYLEVVVTQNCGGNLKSRAVEGTYFQLEVIS